MAKRVDLSWFQFGDAPQPPKRPKAARPGPTYAAPVGALVEFECEMKIHLPAKHHRHLSKYGAALFRVLCEYERALGRVCAGLGATTGPNTPAQRAKTARLVSEAGVVAEELFGAGVLALALRVAMGHLPARGAWVGQLPTPTLEVVAEHGWAIEYYQAYWLHEMVIEMAGAE